MLLKCHPHVALRDCEHCRAWLYDEEKGTVRKQRAGTTKNTRFVDIPRGDIPTPCDDPNQGCPKGHYSNPKTMSERNLMACQYIKEAEVVNWDGISHDSVTRRNAAIIRDIQQNAERSEQYRLMLQVGAIAGLGGSSVNR